MKFLHFAVISSATFMQYRWHYITIFLQYTKLLPRLTENRYIGQGHHHQGEGHSHRHRLVFGQSTIHSWLLQPIVNEMRCQWRNSNTPNQAHSYSHTRTAVFIHTHHTCHPAQTSGGSHWRWRLSARLNDDSDSICTSDCYLYVTFAEKLIIFGILEMFVLIPFP